MNKYFWLNIIYLIFNIYAFANFINDLEHSTGLQTNAAGSIALILALSGGLILILIHIVFTGIMYFTKSTTLTTVTTIIASLITIPVFLLYCLLIVERREAEAEDMRWQKEGEESVRIENSPEGRRHQDFLEAIYTNDSTRVKQMAEQGEKITDEDLSGAIYACFDSNMKISPEIFKTLIDHGADAQKSPPILTYNRFCNNFETVKLLLEAGANPLPEKDVFPLTCLPQLKLLLQYGAGINSLSTVHYDSYKSLDDNVRSAIPQTGRWTPVMVYLKEYPGYFEEAQFLLSQKPDLKYKDENGYTLQILLKDLADEHILMGETVEDLLEFGKKIR